MTYQYYEGERGRSGDSSKKLNRSNRRFFPSIVPYNKCHSELIHQIHIHMPLSYKVD